MQRRFSIDLLEWESNAIVTIRHSCHPVCKIDVQSTVYYNSHLHPIVWCHLHSSIISSMVHYRVLEARDRHRFLLLSLGTIHLRPSITSASISVRRNPSNSLVIGLSRYPYRLYYCLKECEDQILIQLSPVAQHILQANSSYTVFASM